MGTSHRQGPVRDVVGRVRDGLGDLFPFADGYEIVLGNGGSTAFWEEARRGLAAAITAPHVRRVVAEVRDRHGERRSSTSRSSHHRTGTAPHPRRTRRDVIAWAHNETSTGVMVDVRRPTDAGDALVLIDATSGAGGLPVDVGQADAFTSLPRSRSGPTAASGWPR